MSSNPAYGENTNGSEVAERFSEYIKGRNVVVTGVSPESLGGATAVAVARHGPASLVLASRTLSKLENVAKRISEEAPGVQPKLVQMDLGSQAATKKAAEEISSLIDSIDVLIHSAAVTSSDRRETADGLESQFGINHIGPFLLTSLLIPQLKAAAAKSPQPGLTRVVHISSLGYRLSPIRFHDYNFEGKAIPPEEEPPNSVPDYMRPVPGAGKNYHGFCAYGQSKTANILHAQSLTQKLGRDGIAAFANHPGSIWTELSRSLSPDDYASIKNSSNKWKTHDQGIATTLVAAFDPKLSEQTEKVYLSDCQLEDVEDYAKDPDAAERLWQLSEKITGFSAKL